MTFDRVPFNYGSSTYSAPVREMPYNLEVEQGLLGVLLVDNRQLEKCSDIITAQDFYAGAHQRIYTAIMSMVERGLVATPVTLKQYFMTDGDLNDVGGADYLAQLAACIVSIANAKDYALHLADLSLRRGIIEKCQEAQEAAYTPNLEQSAIKIAERLEEGLFVLAEKKATGEGPVDIAIGIEEALKHIEAAQKGEKSGITCGIAAVDNHINGFQKGECIIIAGRPGMGKSALAGNIADNAVQAGWKGAIFNMEMSKLQIALRYLADRTELPMQMMRKKGQLNQEHWDRIISASTQLRNLGLFVDDQAGLSVAQIKARCRRHKRKHGLDFVVIDYLSLIDPGDNDDQMVHQIGKIARALKILARELDIAVFLLAQLSRAVEARDNKRPQLSDLRDSGEIEQHADIVLFVYRSEYYLSKEEPVKRSGETNDKFHARLQEWQLTYEESRGKAEIVVGKQRMGETGILHVAFSGVRQRFYDLI